MPGGAGDGNGEMDGETGRSVSPGRQRAEPSEKPETDSQAAALREREGWMKREETRPLHLLCIEHKILLSHVCWLQAHQPGLLRLYRPTPCCQVVLLLPISILSSAALYLQTVQQLLTFQSLYSNITAGKYQKSYYSQRSFCE